MDTTIDVDDIKLKLPANTKAVIITHYFGFIKDMLPIAEICEQRGLIFIEDCAHALFGFRDGKSVGA